MNIAPGLNGLLAQRQFAQQEQNAGLGQIQGLLGIQQAQQQQGLLAQQMQDKQRQQMQVEAFAQQLPESDRAAFMVNPNAYIQEMNKKYVVGGALVGGKGGAPIYEAPVENKIAPNGQVYNPRQLTPGMTFNDPNKAFGIGPQGVPVPNQAFQNFELDKAARGASKNVTNVNNVGPKEFEKELGKMDAEKLGEFRKNAEAGQGMLGTVTNLRDAIKGGVYSGGLADQKTAAANLINGITGITPKALPGSQLFEAEASKLVLDSIKLLGANPSNADRDFIKKTVPQLATSPQARDALINYLEQKANKNIELFQKADAYARQNKGLGGFNYLGGSAKKITNDAEYNALPSGTEFVGPDGVTRRKP